MLQKKFMDISRIKEDTEMTITNTSGFEVGDHIVIQGKMDGANAAISYDSESNKLVAFSRKNELNFLNTLNGFWNWVQTLDVGLYSKYPDYVFFGEWLTPHTIKYIKDAYCKFYFYDVYDKRNECYLAQTKVKELADELNLIYVNTLYDGEFISLDHCKSFAGQSTLAQNIGEGIVIKNQSKLNNHNSRTPFVLKIVVSQFKEIQDNNYKQKIEDPQKVEARAKAQEIVDKIVTKNRIQKELFKMRDEGMIPEKIEPENMSMIARSLPKRIFDDCMKEESGMVLEAGEFFGKMCSGATMKHARNIIFGE